MSQPGTDEYVAEILATGALTMKLMMQPNGGFVDVECVGYPDPGATNEVRFSLAHMPGRRFSMKVEVVDDERSDGATDGGTSVDEDPPSESNRFGLDPPKRGAA